MSIVVGLILESSLLHVIMTIQSNSCYLFVFPFCTHYFDSNDMLYN